MDPNPKQQAIERIKDATNILVTVSKNPTVDQLAACIGFTLLLNKLGKHATAVFSGAVPSTIEFLQPEKTLEQTTDSLRDFIIALDKSKADKLRYKVEDEVVRIFITPYRTSISEKDLDFSQGDFNVDVVVALGVTNKEDIDQAIVAHGRILHDATVVSITAGSITSDVGSILWHDATSSSLSEMLVSISESFQAGLLDSQMATAFLTGIVSETDRFGNDKTSPKVMTMSAQLMAAGANQQLIAAQLDPIPEEPEPLPLEPVEPYQPPAERVVAIKDEAVEEEEEDRPDGEIEIDHEDDEIHIDDQGNLKRLEEMRLAEEAERKRLEEQAPANNDPDVDKPVPEASSYIVGEGHKIIEPMNATRQDPLAAYAPVSDMPTSADPALQLPPVMSEPDTLQEPIVPAEESTFTQPEPSWSLPALTSQPLDPPQNDSLSSLEQSVGSPHVDSVEDHVDAARQAVTTAGLDSVPRPVAAQSSGAQFMDISQPPVNPAPAGMSGIADVLQQTSAVSPDPVIDPMSPPPVPPPMMPLYTPQVGGHSYLGTQSQPPAQDDLSPL